MSLPPSEIPLGAMRFNSDSQKLEYWMGSAWMQIQTFSPTLDGGARGIRAGGYPQTDRIEFFTISIAGNAIDFGNLSQSRNSLSSTASSTRAVFSNGQTTPASQTTMDYVAIATGGQAVDFGDSLDSIHAAVSISNDHGGLG